MATPYRHSLSSVQKHGGVWKDYFKIHHWFDVSKITFGDFRHRALRHHTAGIDACVAQFGPTLVNADGATVDVRTIAEQHVQEDLQRLPTLEDWFGATKPKGAARSALLSVFDQSDESGRSFGGCTDDYKPIHEWMDDNGGSTQEGWRGWRHHTFGIFWAEQVFGAVITNAAGDAVEVRRIAEQHVTLEFGYQPTPGYWLICLKPQPWMNQPVRLSKEQSYAQIP